MTSKTSFITELKRRNVIRMAGLYLIAGWLIVQVTGALSPMFGAPDWIGRTIVMLLAIGLVPALVFSWVYELTPEGLKREHEVGQHESITPATGHRMDRAIVALLVLAIGAFAFDRFYLTPRRAAPAASAQTGEADSRPAEIPERSIAVLPLANASEDKNEQFFSDGLSENLIIALSQFDGLTVIGRNSSFQFRDSKDDSRTIGAKLGVATLLEGSVQHVGDLVRVSAELISAVNGHTLWSQRYDRPYKDLFALQDDITKEVASALKGRLLTGSNVPAQTDRPTSGNLDAYSAFLRGRFYAARITEEDDRQAIAQYTAATRLDARYARAWAELAQVETLTASRYLADAAARESYSQARHAIETALAIAPDMGEAHSALGRLRQVADFDWTGAEADYRRALELSPNDGAARFGLGELMAALGRPEQAIELTRQALATDPLNARSQVFLASYLLAIGQVEESRKVTLAAIALQPGASTFHWQLTMVEIVRGDAKAALAAAQGEPPGIWRDQALAMALEFSGDSAQADAILKRFLEGFSAEAAYQIAEVYALRNDADRTFEWLDRAWSGRDPGIEYLLTDPFILRFQADPRFAAFCKKAGLPATTTAKALRMPDSKAG